MYIKLRLIVQLLFAVVLQVLIADAVWNGRDCPTPRCDRCVSAAVYDAPGIRFDLTTSYGTAVAHLRNGTVLSIAKVPATPAYQRLMERAGNAPVRSPPSRRTQWQRWWNKKRGLAASVNFETLASLLIMLKSVTVDVLAHPIDRVALTVPSIPALTEENLDDALEYAGLRNWMEEINRFAPKHVTQAHAAFAGNGHGLCPSYQDFMECRDEERAFPRHFGLYISLTRHALYMSSVKMREAFPRRDRDGARLLDFGLGLDARGRFVSDHDYWVHMQTRIVVFTRQYCEQPIDVLLLGGENGTNTDFRQVLQAALKSLTPTWVSPSLDVEVDVSTMSDPNFTAARGMATYARRRQEVPGPCVENPVCEERGEKERFMRNDSKTEL